MLAFITIARLDKSDRVRTLVNDINEISGEISNEVEWLAQLEEVFMEASTVAAGLNDLAVKIKELEVVM